MQLDDTTHDSGHDAQPDSPQRVTDPLERRAIEIELAVAFRDAAAEHFGAEAAQALFDQVVDQQARAAAERFRTNVPEPTLSDLWDVWRHLGGDGRLDMTLDELTDTTLQFHVDRCAYAERYRELGLEDAGVAFSCRRDAPFARAFLPGVAVEQSKTILEGGARCEFTYRLETT